MKNLPEVVLKAWENRQNVVVLTTVSEQGVPNSIYATCASLYDGNKFLVANNKFSKTLKNINSCDKGVLLFITKDNISYQIKGKVKHETEGKAFDDMKSWNPPHLPGKGVAILEIDEVFSGADKLV
jgi:uncharacterized protein